MSGLPRTESALPANKHVIPDILLDFILSREAKLCSPATIDFYRRMLTPFIDSLAGREPTGRDVRQFLSSLRRREVAQATIHAHARAIRAFLRFAHREGYIKAISFEMPQLRQKRVKALTEAQVRRVLSVCDLRDKAIITLLVDSGLRRGEALALSWNDIDFDTGSIYVRQGKGGKRRIVFIGATTRRLLLRWKRRQPTDPIFPISPSGLASALERVSRKSNVKVSAHRLRHTFATIALNSWCCACRQVPGQSVFVRVNSTLSVERIIDKAKARHD